MKSNPLRWTSARNILLLVISFFASIFSNPIRLYLAPDDHTDFIWSATEANYENHFVTMLDYYSAQVIATAGESNSFQSRFSTDGTYWLQVYEKKK